MTTASTVNLSTRTEAFAVATLLARSEPYQCMAKFGQMQVVPKGKTKVVRWRRYEAIALATTPLTEGTKPSTTPLTHSLVTATLAQYGGLMSLTDFVHDTHEDPVLKEMMEILGESAGQTKETLLYNVLRAGSNFGYSNGSARNTVNTAIAADPLRRAIQSLKRQNARPITGMLRASDSVDTKPVPPCYVAFCHPDVERDLQAVTSGFIRVQNYGTWKPLADNEIGSFENIRFLTSTLYTPFMDAGNATVNGMQASPKVNVYPTLIVGRDAYASVALAGSDSITPSVVNPGTISGWDPLGQQGFVGYKFYHHAAILNDAWMYRLEHGVTV